MSEQTSNFYQLHPNDVMTAVEAAGFQPTGEFQQLNSYENRVFDISLEENDSPHDRLIAKFYRPGRWSKQALLDEHEFLLDLKAEGIPAIAPLALPTEWKTLLSHQGMWVALYPRFAGRMPQEFLTGELRQVGRRLAHIHNVGARKAAQHRPRLHPSEYGWQNLEILEPLVERSLWPRYEEAAERILEELEDQLQPDSFFRIHGDCHRGNLLHDGKEFFFVDFDDFLNGPAAQDFWMLFSGAEFFNEECDEILTGYNELREFPEEQLELFEPLRGLRILHYAAWIARRWEDPSFPRLFPDFGSFHYWAEETEALEKIAWQL